MKKIDLLERTIEIEKDFKLKEEKMEIKRKKNLKIIVLISLPILSLFILLGSKKHPKLDTIISIILLISILISLINIYYITKKENKMIKEMINYFNSATDSKAKELKIENTEENEENTIKYFTGYNWEEVPRDKWKMIENIEEVKEIYNCLEIGGIAVIFKNNTKILYKNLGENNFVKLKDYLIKDIIEWKPEIKEQELQIFTL